MYMEPASGSNNLVHPLVCVFSSLKFEIDYLYKTWIYLFYSNSYNTASHNDGSQYMSLSCRILDRLNSVLMER